MRWPRAFRTAIAITLSLSAQQLPFEPSHESGQSVTGAYEGWFANPDGTFSLLLGYFNRNLKQVLEIPIGPNNRIEPGGFDQGQPTQFLPGRQWGVFTITAPKDFGDKKLTWTLTANGKITVIPISLNPLWEVAPFLDARGNSPPFVAFEQTGPFIQGPRGHSVSRTATVGDPLPLPLWVADDAKPAQTLQPPRTLPVTITWTKLRGPGAVTIDNPRPEVEKADFDGPPATTF